VVATIRTVSEKPIYAKLYPYPMGAADFVNSEIQDLLKNGIIQKSKSPYNNPIWVLDKKGVDESGKLNERTIPDRYPMPKISMILGNIGKARYFTTLDLKSGYHQITLAERDREKTSFSVNGGKYEFRRLPFGCVKSRSFKHRKISLGTFKKKFEVNRFSIFPPIHITAKSFFKKHHFEIFAFKVSSSVYTRDEARG